MTSYRMAAVGEADSIIGFLALGVEIHPVTSTGEAAAIFENWSSPKENAESFSSPRRWPRSWTGLPPWGAGISAVL